MRQAMLLVIALSSMAASARGKSELGRLKSCNAMSLALMQLVPEENARVSKGKQLPLSWR